MPQGHAEVLGRVGVAHLALRAAGLAMSTRHVRCATCDLQGRLDVVGSVGEFAPRLASDKLPVVGKVREVYNLGGRNSGAEVAGSVGVAHLALRAAGLPWLARYARCASLDVVGARRGGRKCGLANLALRVVDLLRSTRYVGFASLEVARRAEMTGSAGMAGVALR
jgi:hypothetical protein